MRRNQVSLIFANNSRSKQNKKYPTYPFVDIGKKEARAKFQQKILNCRVVGARQSFQILPGFSKTIELCLNFSIGILHYLISIIEL